MLQFTSPHVLEIYIQLNSNFTETYNESPDESFNHHILVK